MSLTLNYKAWPTVLSRSCVSKYNICTKYTSYIWKSLKNIIIVDNVISNSSTYHLNLKLCLLMGYL
jgi:restriction endonuclease S subunit